jgi:hypothetical protein
MACLRQLSDEAPMRSSITRHHLSYCRIDLSISIIVIGNLSWGNARAMPAVALIELDRSCIQLDPVKVQCFVATSDYLSLSLREQTLADSISPAFAKHPQILQPFSACSNRSDDLRVPYCDPTGMPVLIDRKRWKCPKAAVSLIHNCLDDSANGVVLLGLCSSNEPVDHHQPI